MSHEFLETSLHHKHIHASSMSALIIINTFSEDVEETFEVLKLKQMIMLAIKLKFSILGIWV